MKTRKLIGIAGLLLALCMGMASGQQKISDRASLGSGGLDPAVDFLPIVDTSAGLSGDKKITPNALLTGWGMTPTGKALATAGNAAAQRTALGLSGNIYNLSWGTAAGNLLRLDPTTGKLPAVDGSLLTNLPGGYTIASQAEAEAGTENTKLVTPLRVAQAITALAPGGGGGAVTIATQAEAEAGTENTKLMTPLRVAQAITELGGGGVGPAPDGIELSEDFGASTVTWDTRLGTLARLGMIGNATLVISHAVPGTWQLVVYQDPFSGPGTLTLPTGVWQKGTFNQTEENVITFICTLGGAPGDSPEIYAEIKNGFE